MGNGRVVHAFSFLSMLITFYTTACWRWLMIAFFFFLYFYYLLQKSIGIIAFLLG